MLRYRLRTLLIVLAVAPMFVGGGAVLCRYIRQRVRERQLAMEHIDAWGGHVIFDYEGLRGVLGSDPPGPLWLARTLGDRNAFANVESITFYCNRATPGEEAMKAIVTLKEVRILHLEAPSIEEDELRHLSQLPNLNELSLTGVNLTAASAKHLAPLRRLDRLKVSRTLPANVQEAILQSVPEACSISKGAPCEPLASGKHTHLEEQH